MAYLDESLIPLEDVIKKYLHAEHAIQLLEVELLTQSSTAATKPNNSLAPGMPGERSAEPQQEKQQRMEALLEQYRQLRAQVVQMLPEQNKFFLLNLGYGPSMVGYFTIDHETRQPLPEPVLRVVH